MTTTSTTRLYVHGRGKNQRSTARNLIAGAQNPIQRMRDLTIELYSTEDIVQKKGPLGILFFVRSHFSLHHYFPVSLTAAGYKCTCGKHACDHIRQVQVHQQEKAIA